MSQSLGSSSWDFKKINLKYCETCYKIRQLVTQRLLNIFRHRIATSHCLKFTFQLYCENLWQWKMRVKEVGNHHPIYTFSIPSELLQSSGKYSCVRDGSRKKARNQLDYEYIWASCTINPSLPPLHFSIGTVSRIWSTLWRGLGGTHCKHHAEYLPCSPMFHHLIRRSCWGVSQELSA